LIYPLYLPHLKHLRTILVENFGFLFDFTICDSFAILEILNKPRACRGAILEALIRLNVATATFGGLEIVFI